MGLGGRRSFWTSKTLHPRPRPRRWPRRKAKGRQGRPWPAGRRRHDPHKRRHALRIASAIRAGPLGQRSVLYCAVQLYGCPDRTAPVGGFLRAGACFVLGRGSFGHNKVAAIGSDLAALAARLPLPSVSPERTISRDPSYITHILSSYISCVIANLFVFVDL